ncbi:MAG: HlyD family efflux transporter periplasmic adaptor subunit [Cyanobacteria bacterium RM1_2_2]|nr:HlyD family efflux transporter periplasmic adaptor subunit [Cyanobacteria bacterium RM1_2_2]
MQKSLTRMSSSWIVIVIALAGLGFWLNYRTRGNQTVPSVSSEVQPVRAVAALGRIEPEGSVIKVSVVNAKDSRVDQLLVKQGDRVQAGQIIAILQGLDKQQAAVVEAERNVAVQQAKLAQTQAGSSTSSQRLAQQAAIRRLEAELRTELIEKQAAIRRQESELENARTTYQRFEKLYREGAVSALDLDNYRKTYETAETQLNTAQAQLANTAETLSAEIAQAQATLTNLSEVRPIDVKVPQSEVEYAVSQLQSAQAKLEDFYVRVPVAGRILNINTRIGEQVNADEGIVDLGQTDRMYVVAEVYETDVSRVQIGQRTTIVSENGGFTQKLQGTVEQIGLQIKKADVLSTDPAADSNARVVEARIRLDPQDSKQVDGLTYMQVRVNIHPDSVARTP